MKEENSQRVLSAAEERRQKVFDQKTQELNARGYTAHELTVSPKSANLKGVAYGFLPAIPFVVAYFVIYRSGEFKADEGVFIKYLIFVAALLASIVVHELIHGLFWGLFSKEKFKSIEFGVIWKSLNPYCTCCEPLTKAQYLIGSLMPGFLLGIVPCAVALYTHNPWVLFFGVIMTASAGGDILVALELIKYKSGGEVLFYDHPTAIGLVAFEKSPTACNKEEK